MFLRDYELFASYGELMTVLKYFTGFVALAYIASQVATYVVGNLIG